MSILFNILRDVLTPYANKINLHSEEIEEVKADLDVVGNEIYNSSYTAIDFAQLLGVEQFPLGWRNGIYNVSTGAGGQSNNYIRTLTGGENEIVAPEGATKIYAKAPDGYYIAIYEYTDLGQYVRRIGMAYNTTGEGTTEIEAEVTDGYIYKLAVGFLESGGSANLLTQEFINQIECAFISSSSKLEALDSKIDSVSAQERTDRGQAIDELKKELTPTTEKNYSNYTIVCAKERNYSDGTKTSVEWYLVESPDKEFFITKDFVTMKHVFTASYNSFTYKYAVMPNNDIIAVYRTEEIPSGASEDNRQNPYVYLASENWSIEHEVDFGSSLKPSGWLENCGFLSMPDGNALFCEYTRPSVLTANCWKIGGDLTNSSNWRVVKSFQLSGETNVGFKHCHAVQYDFYADVYYLSTGDDDVSAQLWYSIDSGETWSMARSASEKYCRMLNMVFTEDYIYWASDTQQAGMHYLFRCERNQNGIVDYETITELADLYISGVATYGLVYIEDMNTLVILDRCDGKRTSVLFRAFDLTAGTLHTIKTLYTANGEAQYLGFRVEYFEPYPRGGYVLCGFGKQLSLATYRNFIKALGNAGNPNGWNDNVNNLKIGIYKKANGYGCVFKTAFMPQLA